MDVPTILGGIHTKWFNQLEPILKTLGASYYEDTACHLDLVQWSTKPIWSGLSDEDRKHLLAEDVPFLIQLLKMGKIRYLLLNGKEVVTQLKKCFEMNLVEQELIVAGESKTTKLYTGILFGRIHVIGWSTNLQSSFGVTNKRRKALAERVRQIAKQPNANRSEITITQYKPTQRVRRQKRISHDSNSPRSVLYATYKQSKTVLLRGDKILLKLVGKKNKSVLRLCEFIIVAYLLFKLVHLGF